jgi:DNA repair exonuclease SbcCD ATPase subunit
MDDLKSVLAQLDVNNDMLWSDDGAPRLDAVSSLAGRKVTRKELNEVAPGFSRLNPELDNLQPDQDDDQDDEPTLDAEAPELAEVERLQAEAAKAQEAADKAAAAAAAIQRKLDEARVAYEEANAVPHQNQVNIMQYLETQKQIRIARAEHRKAALAALNGDVSALQAKAPIDAARGRPGGFSGLRPAK